MLWNVTISVPIEFILSISVAIQRLERLERLYELIMLHGLQRLQGLQGLHSLLSLLRGGILMAHERCISGEWISDKVLY